MKNVFLSDLTHTGQTIALNGMPFSVGELASYEHAISDIRDYFRFQLFKYPQRLIPFIPFANR